MRTLIIAGVALASLGVERHEIVHEKVRAPGQSVGLAGPGKHDQAGTGEAATGPFRSTRSMVAESGIPGPRVTPYGSPAEHALMMR